MRSSIAIILVAALFVPGTLAAQTPAGRTLSVEQAMDLAREKTEGVQAARARHRRAGALVRSAQSAYWPQLNGVTSYERTLDSEFDDISFGPPVDPAAMEGDEDAPLGDLPFGQENIWRIGVSLSQEIWSFGRTARRVAIARAVESRTGIDVTSTGAQAALSAAQAYYDALLAQELLEIAELSLAQATETLRTTELGFEQGAMPEFDVLRARVTRENQTITVAQRRSDRDLALLRLRQLTGLPLDEAPLTLTSPLEANVEAAAGTRSGGGTAASSEVDRRAPVRIARETLRLNEESVGLARAGYLPNLALVSSYGLVNYPNALFPGVSDWRTNWTVGVNLSFPIFTGFRTTALVEVARADVEQARALLEETRRAAVVDARSSQETLTVAAASWQQSALTVKQAERAYEIAELRFEQGISTHLDLVDSRLLLDQARVNRARAARNVHVARIRLELLPDLPLGTGTALPVEDPTLPGEAPDATAETPSGP